MGFRSRVRQYVRSLTARRRSQTVVNFSTPAPPPSTLPGTALSPISEESSHLRTLDSENYSRSTLDRGEQPRISVLNDDPPTLTTISFNADALTRSSPGPEIPPNNQNHRFARRTTPDPTNPNVRTNLNASLTGTQLQSSTQIQTRHYTNNDDTVQSSSAPVPSSSSSPALHGDQFTPLGPSKCFIIPAGKDDFLVRILHRVHLGNNDKDTTRLDEIKISAPNAYYSPKIGHCVLLQCGDEQWIARVLIRIPAEGRRGSEESLRFLYVNQSSEERNLSGATRILGEETAVSRSLNNPIAIASEFGSPNMNFNDITLLHTPARVRVSRERGEGSSRVYSLDGSTDYSHSGHVSTIPAPPVSTPVETPIHARRDQYSEPVMSREENQGFGNQNQSFARPHSQIIHERQRNEPASTVHLEGGQRQSSSMTRQSFENFRRRNSQHSQHSQAETAQTELDISGPEQMGSSLSDLRDLPGFGTPYVPPSGESSGWNTPHPLPHSPPRQINRTLWPRRTYLQGWGLPPYPGGDSSTDSLTNPISDAERERERQRQQQQQQQPVYLYPLPPGGGSQVLPYPPGFAPYHQLPPQYRTPTRAPDGVWFYTDSAGSQAPLVLPPTVPHQPTSPYVRFSDKATLRQEVGSEMREIPLVSVVDSHSAGTSPTQPSSVPASALRRHSNTIALPPSPSSPESNSDSET